jgi:hypothetical protein
MQTDLLPPSPLLRTILLDINMHHHHRNYPYDNSSTTYGQPQLPLPPTGSYIPNHHNAYDDHTYPIHPGMNTTNGMSASYPKEHQFTRTSRAE